MLKNSKNYLTLQVSYCLLNTHTLAMRDDTFKLHRTKKKGTDNR